VPSIVIFQRRLPREKEADARNRSDQRHDRDETFVQRGCGKGPFGQRNKRNRASGSRSDRKKEAEVSGRAGVSGRVVERQHQPHDPGKHVSFFGDDHCSKLINVALSRAKDRLLVLGSRAMVDSLSIESPFWRSFVVEFGRGMTPIPCSDLLDDSEVIEHLGKFADAGRKDVPAIYSHPPRCGPVGAGGERLRAVAASRKLLVVDKAAPIVSKGDFIARQGRDNPEVFMAGGHLCLRYGGG